VAVAEPADAGPPRARPWSGGGREELAAAVRRLMALTVTATAPTEVLADAAERATALADELERRVPEVGPVPTTRFADHSVRPQEVDGLAAAMPFDMIIGGVQERLQLRGMIEQAPARERRAGHPGHHPL